MEWIKRVVGWLAVICYIVLITFALLFVPMLFGNTPIIVESQSMEPTIKTGSIIYYYKISSVEQLNTNDVITFKNTNEGPMVTHRLMVIEEGGKKMYTMGDNNPTMDKNTISLQNIVGKVQPYYLPYMGFLLRLTQQPFVVGIVVLIIVGNVALSFVGGKEENEEENDEEEPKKEQAEEKQPKTVV